MLCISVVLQLPVTAFTLYKASRYLRYISNVERSDSASLSFYLVQKKFSTNERQGAKQVSAIAGVGFEKLVLATV